MTDHATGPWKHPVRPAHTPWIAREGAILAAVFAGIMTAALALSALTAPDTGPTPPATQEN